MFKASHQQHHHLLLPLLLQRALANHHRVRTRETSFLQNFPVIKIVKLSTTPLRRKTLHKPLEHPCQRQKQAHPKCQHLHPQEEDVVQV